MYNEDECIQQISELLQELGLEILQIKTSAYVTNTIFKLQYGINIKLHLNEIGTVFNYTIQGSIKTYCNGSAANMTELKVKLVALQKHPEYINYIRWLQTCPLDQQTAQQDFLLQVNIDL